MDWKVTKPNGGLFHRKIMASCLLNSVQGVRVKPNTVHLDEVEINGIETSGRVGAVA